MRVELSECAEDERLSNSVRGQRRVCWCTCSHNASQRNKVGAKPRAPLQVHAVLSRGDAPCALQLACPGTSLDYDVGPYQNDSSPACAASRTWQPTDALTLSGPATLVSQQQLQLQHHTAAAYTTNYSLLSHSFRDPGLSFSDPQQPQPLQRLQHRTPICLSRRRYEPMTNGEAPEQC